MAARNQDVAVFDAFLAMGQAFWHDDIWHYPKQLSSFGPGVVE
jgi:hypothetical protein